MKNFQKLKLNGAQKSEIELNFGYKYMRKLWKKLVELHHFMDAISRLPHNFVFVYGFELMVLYS